VPVGVPEKGSRCLVGPGLLSCSSSAVAGVHHRSASSRCGRVRAASAVDLLGAQRGMSLKRSMPSPVGRQHALCMDIWK